MGTETYMKEIYELLENLQHTIDVDLDGDEDLKVAYDQKIRDILYGEHPECYLGFKGMGTKNREIPFFPICNRKGAYDPRMIKFSIKLARKMKEFGKFNNKHLDLILVKLIDLDKKHSERKLNLPEPQEGVPIPTTYQEKLFYKIKSYLDMVV